MGLGDAPGISYGAQSDYKKLFFSEEQAALRVPITLLQGFGKIEIGTAMARHTSASAGTRVGQYIPYDPTATITGAEAFGRSYLLADSAGAQAAFHVSIEDSYKFVVADDVVLVGSGESAENLGAIVSIDRTTYANYAVITATTNVSGGFTTAAFAYAVLEGYDVCKGILQESRDTGTGSKANGAPGNLIISNAVLYTGMLAGNWDAAAIVDMSAVAFGQYTKIP